MQLSALPDDLNTLLSKRPDLEITIRKLDSAGFDLRIADDIRDPDGKPMLVIGERDPNQASAGTAQSSADTSAPQQEPRRARERHKYPDPRTFRPRTPEAKLQKQIDKRGGMWSFPALFDLQGRPVPAKRLETQYGPRWLVFDNPEMRGKPRYIPDSKSPNVQNRVNWMAEKQLQIGTVMARAQAVPIKQNGLAGAIAVRTDGGFDSGARIVETFTEDHYEQRFD